MMRERHVVRVEERHVRIAGEAAVIDHLIATDLQPIFPIRLHLKLDRTLEIHHFGVVIGSTRPRRRRLDAFQIPVRKSGGAGVPHADDPGPRIRKSTAVKGLGPRGVKVTHFDLASLTGTLAERSTRRDGVRKDGADGGVHGAEEELDVGRAAELDEGGEGVHIVAGLLLVGVAHQVGVDGAVVGDALAHGDRDGLAEVVLGVVGIRRGRREPQGEEQEGAIPDPPPGPRHDELIGVERLIGGRHLGPVEDVDVDRPVDKRSRSSRSRSVAGWVGCLRCLSFFFLSA